MKNTKSNVKMITFPERDSKKSAQKVKNLHFGTLEHLPYFAFSRRGFCYIFMDSIPERCFSPKPFRLGNLLFLCFSGILFQVASEFIPRATFFLL